MKLLSITNKKINGEININNELSEVTITLYPEFSKSLMQAINILVKEIVDTGFNKVDLLNKENILLLSNTDKEFWLTLKQRLYMFLDILVVDK